ncbi:Leucine-rich repeat-containing protein 45 [Bagarius yarrelli]|uniref:Leucine-rich repeat-containing protein 45 n=1 Tax=Bagarius yarrelli TaxID=175774 RepID=A0A556TIE4_BAGYA|nr:Leucine-rich repeat-containing protein 45 [Bagarius yarrelli]
MEDFRRAFQQLCKEAGVEPQESVLLQLQELRAGASETKLDLSGQSLTVESCSILGKTLQNDTHFTQLILCDCMLSEEGSKLLLKGLCSNTTVKLLDLKGNNLRGAGAEALGKMLVRNKTLQRLVLEWNTLGMWDEYFSVFCEGLASNNSLIQLDLRNNQINHKGAAEIALALKSNLVLQELDLRWNNIGLLGGRALLEALQQNRSLLQLTMAGNNIPSDVLRAIEQSMDHKADRHSTLRESCSKTQVLSKEIQILKEEKNRQFLSLMETIDKQRDEMGRSSRTSSVRLGQLQEALNERKSVVNSLTAKLQMTEAALTMSEQKANNLADLLTKTKTENMELVDRHHREMRKQQELEEAEQRCKGQQDQIFELKQDLTNSIAELKLRLSQTEQRLETEKRRSKQALEDMDSLHQKEVVAHINKHQEENERALQDRILKLEGQRIQLEEDLSRVKAAMVTERAQAEEELGRVRAQVHLEEQQQLDSMEEKLRSMRQSRDEAQSHCTQQKQTITELHSRLAQQTIELDTLRRRIDTLQQELVVKEQEKVAEVTRVKVELQEQIGHLQAERTAQNGLKEKIAALERQIKGFNTTYREALLDKESEISSLQERLRMREAEIQRIREDEAQRASFLQNAILTYVHGSTHGHYKPKK